MQGISKFTSFLVFLTGVLFFSQTFSARATAGEIKLAGDSLEILFFANANALLENCHCGTPSLGGLARLNTIVARKRQKNPDVLLIDGGDFFNPYAYYKLNLAVVQIYQILRPDILALGEQEFVEGGAFLWRHLNNWSAVVTSNFDVLGKKTARQQKILLNGKAVTILTYLDKSSFDVIPFDNKQLHMKPARFEKLYAGQSAHSYLIVVFHGSVKSLKSFVTAHPRVDLILAAHTQEEKYELAQKPAIVYGGVDTRFIYDVQILFAGVKNHVRCQPIPVSEDTKQDQRIVPIIKQFKTGS